MELVAWKYGPDAGITFFRGLVTHRIRRAIGVQWRRGFIGILLTEPCVLYPSSVSDKVFDAPATQQKA